MTDLTYERARKIRDRQWAILGEIKRIDSIISLNDRVKIFAEFTHDHSNHVQSYDLTGIDIHDFLKAKRDELSAEAAMLDNEFNHL